MKPQDAPSQPLQSPALPPQPQSTPPSPSLTQQPTASTTQQVQLPSVYLASSATWHHGTFNNWKNGQLVWANDEVIRFVEESGQELIAIPVNTISKASFNVTMITLKSSQGKHNFILGGMKNVAGATASMALMMGSVAGSLGADAAIRDSGIEAWIQHARRYPHIKVKGQTQGEEWKLAFKIAGGFFAILIFAALVNAALSSS